MKVYAILDQNYYDHGVGLTIHSTREGADTMLQALMFAPHDGEWHRDILEDDPDYYDILGSWELEGSSRFIELRLLEGT